jgi:hypothetical protein
LVALRSPGPIAHHLAQGEPKEDGQPNHQQNYLSQRHVHTPPVESLRVSTSRHSDLELAARYDDGEDDAEQHVASPEVHGRMNND